MSKHQANQKLLNFSQKRKKKLRISVDPSFTLPPLKLLTLVKNQAINHSGKHKKKRQEQASILKKRC